MAADWTKIVAYDVRLETDLRTAAPPPETVVSPPTNRYDFMTKDFLDVAEQIGA